MRISTVVVLSFAGHALGALIWLPGKVFTTYGTARVETAYTSYSPDTFVKTSVVSLFVPLDPLAVGIHPLECDYVVSQIGGVV